MRTYVLDSFALLALFRNEPGARRVEDLFSLATTGEAGFVISAVNLGEVVYKTFRQSGEPQAQITLAECRALPITVVPIDEPLAISGAIIKGAYPISYADCIAAALAQRLGATLVTGDDGFRQIPDLQVEWLQK